jgi:hypothetical protein
MSGILDKFIILFSSDAAAAKKDIDALNTSLDGTEKSANKTTDATTETNKQFLGLGKYAWGAIGGIAALTSSFAGLFVTMDRMRTLEGLSTILEEDIELLDAWGGATYRMGGSAEQFKGTIMGLQSKLTDASIRGYNDIIPYFHQLGISIIDDVGKVKSAVDLLPEIAASFERVGKRRAVGIGGKLGLDLATIKLLTKGTEGVEYYLKRQRELGLVTRDAGELAFKYGLAIKDFTHTLKYAAQIIFVAVAPAITYFIQKLTNLSTWFQKHDIIVKGFFIGLGIVAIPVLYGIAVAAWAAVAPMIAMTAVALAAAWPFILLAAAIVGTSIVIALLVEDMIAFDKGQDSLMGRIAEKWGAWGKAIKWIIKDIKDLVIAFNALNDLVEKIDPWKAGAAARKWMFGSDDENIIRAKDQLAFASLTPLGSQTSSSIQTHNKSVSRTTTIQFGDMTIETQATDSEGIANEITDSIKNQMSTTVDNFDDGLDR